MHVPVGCYGQPDTSYIVWDESELEVLDEDVFDKIELKMEILRERIESQCNANADHDRLHGG